jgi:Fic family protein
LKFSRERRPKEVKAVSILRRGKAKMSNWQKFMLESNRIEGEDRLNPGDEDAFFFATNTESIWYVEDILLLHQYLGSYLKRDWVGKWRNCGVRVGNYIPPKAEEVPNLMADYAINLTSMNSFEAHNEFEYIHPFRDLNGRVGRLIWLSKAVNEGYDFSIPFLQKYYYQALAHYNQTETR